MEKPIIGILGNTYKTQPGNFFRVRRECMSTVITIEGVSETTAEIPMAIPAVAMKADPKAYLPCATAFWFLAERT